MLVILAGACNSNSSDGSATESAGDTGGGSSGATTGAGSTTGGTGDAATSSGGASTGDVPTTSEGSSTTAEETTGGVEDPVCSAYCERLDECADPQAADCAQRCPAAAKGHAFIGEACLALYSSYTSCVAGLTCEQLGAEPPACGAEQDALLGEACTTPTCRDYCDYQVGCGLQEPGSELQCASDCSLAQAEAFVDAGEACASAISGVVMCLQTLECDQLDPPQGCGPEFTAQANACD